MDCNLNWKARVPQSVPVNSARFISSESYNVLCLVRLALPYASRYPVVNLQTLMTVYYEYFFMKIQISFMFFRFKLKEMCLQKMFYLHLETARTHETEATQQKCVWGNFFNINRKVIFLRIPCKMSCLIKTRSKKSCFTNAN